MIKITVGLITYNRPLLLKRAVNSLLNQSYKNFSLLIGNDYPNKKITFKTLGIKKNKKVFIYNHKKNLGERNNMNFLLKKSNSEWFIWLADDDYFHKNLFKRLLDAIDKSPKNIVACYSNYSRKKLNKKIIRSKATCFNKKDFLKGFTKKEIRMIGAFGLIKTKLLKKIKGIHKTGKSFHINNKITHHYPYCDPLVPIMLSNYGNILWLNERLVYLNTDMNSISSYSKEYDVYKSSEQYIYKKLYKSIKKINKTDQIHIKNNMLEWFFFNRLNIIEKRNIFFNLSYLVFYIIDVFIFDIKYQEKLNLKTMKKNFRLIKSIFKSIYKE